MAEKIYLDNAATTKMFEKCVDIYKNYACNIFYNPSAGYADAIKNSADLAQTRKLIKSKFGLNAGDVIFTSGATESNNLAILGSARSGKWEYVFSVGEHPSVYNAALELQNRGNIVHFVPLLPNGEVDYDKLAGVLNAKTRLVSVMHVSNETGAINDLKKINDLRVKLAPQALLHIDGVQAFCKIPFDLKSVNPDFYTISAHKFHGPKGVGALYVKNIETLKSIVFGGGQEFGKRSGTENLPAIMAMKCAIESIDVEKNFESAKLLKTTFLKEIDGQKGVNVLQTCEKSSSYIISLSFDGVNGETLMRALENQVIVGTGSACSSHKAGNRVLENLGLAKDRIKWSVRVSFNAYQTVDEVEKAAKIIIKTYNEILEKVK